MKALTIYAGGGGAVSGRARLFAAQVAIAASVAGCGNSGPRMDKESIADRASIVRVCPDGSVIGHDTVSGRYVWGNGWTRSMIAPGLTPDQVCGGRR